MKIKLLFLLWMISECSLQAQVNHRRIDSLMCAVHEMGIFNGNVLVKHNGQVLYRNSMGFADADRLTLLDTNMLFDIGSIAKEFNAVSLLLLQERGELSVADPVSKYIAELPAWSDSVRIRHLLNYSSGLPQTTSLSDLQNLQELRSLKGLYSKPGALYCYSYSNVYLQRKIIEQVSGMTYQAFVEQNLFKPLGMRHAKIDLPVSSRQVAKSFDSRFRRIPYNPEPQGWVRIDLEDLSIWQQALDEGKLLSKASLKILAKRIGDGECSLGRVEFKGDALALHQHQGAYFNYEALISNDLSSGIQVILLTNNQQFKVNRICDAIRAILAGHSYVLPKRSLYLDLREKVLQDYAQGLEFYKEVMRSGSDRYDLSFVIGDLINTGKFLMRRKRPAEALGLLQLGRELKGVGGKDHSYALQLAGECYLELQDEARAKSCFTDALKLDPGNKTAGFQLEQLLKPVLTSD